MNLDEAKKRINLEIISINDEKFFSDALRFGIEVGSIIQIITKLPNGPIVIKKNEQQIAIGKELTKIINVREIN